MRTTAFYILRNDVNGSETRHDEFSAALEQVGSVVNEGEEWTIVEVDPLRLELAACDRRRAPVAMTIIVGCGPAHGVKQREQVDVRRSA